MRTLSELVKESGIEAMIDGDSGEDYYDATEESLRKFRKLVLEDVGKAVESIIDRTVPDHTDKAVLNYCKALKEGF